MVEGTAQNGGEGPYLTLKVLGPATQEIHFRVRTTTKLEKLKKTLRERLGKGPDQLTFLFDDNWINDDDTPEGLDMEDGDVIEVFEIP